MGLIFFKKFFLVAYAVRKNVLSIDGVNVP